jgi:hypothetical protein
MIGQIILEIPQAKMPVQGSQSSPMPPWWGSCNCKLGSPYLNVGNSSRTSIIEFKLGCYKFC